MLIAVAGPYSAPTEEERRRNLCAMRDAAAEVARRGHVPVIGVDVALPVVDRLHPGEGPGRYDAIMSISLEVVGRCDALLIIAESPGANRERDLLLAMGRPIYRSVEELPA